MTLAVLVLLLQEIGALIGQLGLEDPAARNRATQALAALGEKALPDLRKAALGGDPEVIARSKAIIERIEHDLLLAKVAPEPKHVTLHSKGAAVGKLLQEIGRQADYPITVDPDLSKLAAGLIDLEDVPFMLAVDRILAHVPGSGLFLNGEAFPYRLAATQVQGPLRVGLGSRNVGTLDVTVTAEPSHAKLLWVDAAVTKAFDADGKEMSTERLRESSAFSRIPQCTFDRMPPILSRLELELIATYAIEIATVRLEPGNDEQETKSHGITLRHRRKKTGLDGVDQRMVIHAVAEATGECRNRVRMMPAYPLINRDANGKEMDRQPLVVAQNPEGMVGFFYSVPDGGGRQVASVEVTLPTVVASRIYTFEFRNMKLRNE